MLGSLNISDCATELCDISVYGGCTDTGHSIFVGGFTAVSVQLIVLVAARLVFLRSIPNARLSSTCPDITVLRCGNGQLSCKCCDCCQPGCTMGFSFFIAAVALEAMAQIRLYESAGHFVAAFIAFIALGVGTITDMRCQRNMRVHRMLDCWNTFFSVGGLVCFYGWLVIGAVSPVVSTISQYVAATAPLIYVMPWAYQALTYEQQRDLVGYAVMTNS